MTTFTSDDREEAYKKIVEAAPNQPGYEDAVPIPFAGWVSTKITDVEAVAWIDRQDLERLPHYDCWVNGQEHKNSVPLYTHPVKELTNVEIQEICAEFLTPKDCTIYTFARAILRKAQEK